MKESPPGIQHYKELPHTGILYGGNLICIPQSADRLRLSGYHQIQRIGLNALSGYGGIVDGVDLYAVEVDIDHVRSPVVGVAYQHRHLILYAALHLERTGAHRHLIERSIPIGSG